MRRVSILFFCVMFITTSVFAADFNKFRKMGSTEGQLRNDPSTQSPSIIPIPKSSRLQVLGKKTVKQGLLLHNWYKVKYNGKVGWVSGLVLEDPDELTLDIPEDQRILGQLRPLMEATMGKHHKLKNFSLVDQIFTIEFELESFNNKDIDFTNVKNVAFRIMDVFVKEKIQDFLTIKIIVTTDTGIKEGTLSKITVLYQAIKDLQADPYIQKTFESFTFDDSLYISDREGE